MATTSPAVSRSVEAVRRLHRVRIEPTQRWLARRFGANGPVYLIFGLGVLVQGAILVWLARDLFFIGDDWDFLLTRGTIPGESLGWWAPHNQHWSTFHVLVFRSLFSLFGLQYLPYAVLQILMHLVVATCVLAVLLRAGAGRGPALFAAWWILFMGAGTEILLSTTSLNHMGSLATAMVAGVLYQRMGLDRRSLPLIWALLLISVMWSASGIPAVAFVAAWVAFDRSLRAGALVAILPAVAHVTWYLLAGREGGADLPHDGESYLNAPEFFWHGLTNVFAASTGIPGAGTVLLLAVVGVAVGLRCESQSLQVLVWAGLAGSAFFMGMVAAFRMTWGLESTESGRYVYAVMLFLSPVIAMAVSALADASRLPSRGMIAVGVVAAVLLAVQGVRAEHDYHDSFGGMVTKWPDRLQGILAAVDDGQEPLTKHSGDWAAEPTLNAELVSAKAIRHAMPKGSPSKAARLDVEMMFFTRISQVPAGLSLPQGGDLRTWFGFTQDLETKGCTTLPGSGNPTVVLDTGDRGAQFTILSGSGEYTLELVRGSTHSYPRSWPVEPNTNVWVSTSARNAELVLTSRHSGSYTICR